MKKFDTPKEVIDFWFSSAEQSGDRTSEVVRDIISNVRLRKDSALKEYTLKFDSVSVEQIRVDAEDIQAAQRNLSPELKDIFLQAAENIRSYHARQIPQSWRETDENGITLGQQYTPVESVGIYVPGGRAVYPSTVLMNCIPAQVAGVERIVIVSPPGQDGKLAPAILGCAGLLGISEIYAVGGAQAIAALAYGTESILPVAKITGPGNKFVNEAKKQVFGKVGIDMPAGPTEVAILADDSVPVEYVAWDIAAQAEHDPDAKTVLITNSKVLLSTFEQTLENVMKSSPRRDYISQSTENNGGIVLVDSIESGIELINQIAPEHTELLIDNANEFSKKIRNSGAVFLGQYTPGAVGDYWAGPNHTLPTGGAAKFASPLNVLDFMKFTSYTGYTWKALSNASKFVSTFAKIEQLFAHAQSVEIRNG